MGQMERSFASIVATLLVGNSAQLSPWMAIGFSWVRRERTKSLKSPPLIAASLIRSSSNLPPESDSGRHVHLDLGRGNRLHQSELHLLRL